MTKYKRLEPPYPPHPPCFFKGEGKYPSSSKYCWIWIRIRMNPHYFGNPDPHPHQIKIRIRIRIRIKVISLIRIRIHINLQMTTQNVWKMSLFEHFFKGLSLYLEAKIRIRVKSRIRIIKNQDPDPHTSDKSDLDSHQSDNSDPDPHQGDADPQQCWILRIWIDCKVFYTSSLLGVDPAASHQTPWMRRAALVRPAATFPANWQILGSMLRIRIRDPVPFCPLDPGSGISFFRIPDPKPICLRA